MKALDVVRCVREKLDAIYNSEDENASIYDDVNLMIAELRTVEKICENVPIYMQSDVIGAFFGWKEGENES